MLLFGNTLSAKSVRSFLSFKSSFEVILNAYSSNFFFKNRGDWNVEKGHISDFLVPLISI